MWLVGVSCGDYDWDTLRSEDVALSMGAFVSQPASLTVGAFDPQVSCTSRTWSGTTSAAASSTSATCSTRSSTSLSGAATRASSSTPSVSSALCWSSAVRATPSVWVAPSMRSEAASFLKKSCRQLARQVQCVAVCHRQPCSAAGPSCIIAHAHVFLTRRQCAQLCAAAHLPGGRRQQAGHRCARGAVRTQVHLQRQVSGTTCPRSALSPTSPC